MRLQLEAVGLGHLWVDGDLDLIAYELDRRRTFALEGTAGSRALSLASGLTEFWRGDFARSVELMELVLVDAESRSDHVAATAARAVIGMIWSIRGDGEAADVQFDLALAQSALADAPALDATVRSMRIAVSDVPAWDAVACELDGCRRTAERLDRPDLGATVDLAEGWALASLGRFGDAETMLRRSAEGAAAPLERSIATLRLAEVLLLDGRRDEALEVATSTLAVFEAWRARYWTARTSMFLASFADDRGGRRVGAALAMAPDDLAYARLRSPDGEIVINLRSGPAVTRDGAPVTFLTRHAEAAVRLLAAAGPKGVDVGELVALLWPEADESRVGQRMRTMLWQVRSALGPDSWRLQRRRDLVTLDLTGIDVSGRLDRPSIAAAFH